MAAQYNVGAGLFIQGTVTQQYDVGAGIIAQDIEGALSLVSVLPTATQSAGTWTPTGAATVHQCLNDASDSTYAAAAGATVFVVQLAAVTNPGSTSNHKIKFRGSSSSSSQFKMSLYDGIPGSGGTLIEEWTETLTGSVAEYTHDCSPTNIANINAASYYGSLYLCGEAL